MKEKKAGRVFILIIFVLTICLSELIWLCIGDRFDSSNSEKRQLASRPRLAPENYDSFAADYTAYFNDHMPFRNKLISVKSEIDYYCFDKSSNGKVIIGTDGWLFYDSKSDGNPIGCYKGKELYSEEELEAIMLNCIEQRNFAESLGKEFVIFIAPNKERIYYEHMPKRYGEPSEEYRVRQIYEYIKANSDLRIIYPYDELMEAKRRLSENIYLKTDTHWSAIGAYVGSAALMSELGIQMPDLYSGDIEIRQGKEDVRDLGEMLQLGNLKNISEHEYVLSGYNTHAAELLELDYSNLIRYRSSESDSRRIYVIKDSFSNAMAPYIGSQFSEAYLKFVDKYSYEEMIAVNPDIIVYETVERYADRLGTFSIR